MSIPRFLSELKCYTPYSACADFSVFFKLDLKSAIRAQFYFGEQVFDLENMEELVRLKELVVKLLCERRAYFIFDVNRKMAWTSFDVKGDYIPARLSAIKLTYEGKLTIEGVQEIVEKAFCFARNNFLSAKEDLERDCVVM